MFTKTVRVLKPGLGSLKGHGEECLPYCYTNVIDRSGLGPKILQEMLIYIRIREESVHADSNHNDGQTDDTSQN